MNIFQYLKYLILCGLALQIFSDFSSEYNWTLVWLVGHEWEKDYVPQQLLKYVKVDNVIERRFPYEENGTNAVVDVIKDYTIFVMRQHLSFEPDPERNAEFSKKVLELGTKKIVVLLMGDESIPTDNKCSKADTFDKLVAGIPLIVRNYFTVDCAEFPNVLQVPLGILNALPFDDILKNTLPMSERKYVWSFSSNHITPMRGDMLAAMNRINSSYLEPHHYVYPVGVGNGQAFIELLAHSKFSLAPDGNVPETWRFYEIMEFGAIPVINVTSFHNYHNLVIPCNITDYLIISADPATEIIWWMSRPEELERHRQKLISTYNIWRDDWKANVGRRIHDIGAGGTGKSASVSGGLYWDFISCRKPHHFHHFHRRHHLVSFP